MARHRDIRNMDYEDEYDGYDDIYGHSVDDDYYISPSNRQFIYNRENSRDSRFEHEEDIQEVDEFDELSDTDKAKLNSCIDQVKDTLGHIGVPKSELVNLILKNKFNVELVINAVLEDSKSNPAAKDKGKMLFKTLSPSKGFIVPNIFGTPKSFNKQATKNFVIPSIFGASSNKPSNSDNFDTLSELVSSHLKTTNNLDLVVEKVSEISLSEPPAKSKSLASNEPINNFNIDLSVALKASSSLPIFSKNKVKEKFEIPFIDGDLVSRKATNNLTKVKLLPCTLDITKTLSINNNDRINKKPSKLAKVLCRKYKHKKHESLITSLEFKNPIQKPIRIFMFHTQSPDDYITSFLKKRQNK